MKQSDCALQMSKYSLHNYVKAMLKRRVFRARRKEGCESLCPEWPFVANIRIRQNSANPLFGTALVPTNP